ncbi:MAG TPA: hypothetical protein DFR83_27045 [Deltaproteobacteria bacterium]|nr:hypothetical protein [Deltaproteobacteria bacterium]
MRVGCVDPKYRGKVAGDRTGIGFLTNQTVQGSLSPEDRAHARGLYLAEVAWADQQLGRLLDGLRERNLLDDSLVVLFSDHGEMFDEEPARPWRHGPDVDLPIIHVPLIVSGTGTLATPQRTVVPTTVRTLDIGSTLLNAIGQSDPLGEGRDLSTLWRGQPPEDWPVALAEATKPLEQLRTDTWPNANLERAAVSQTQITTRAPWLDALDHSFQRDAVQTPTATPEPSLTAALDAFDARQPDHRSPAYGNETRDALKALGYLDD